EVHHVTACHAASDGHSRFQRPEALAGRAGGHQCAHGATGKSFWALEAAMSIACSVAGGDVVNLKPQHTGRVVY
ncbi:helicase RepA family protein, partial [Aeromonas caviae]|uniref:helicase RepA family protein n=1 Tax=Aeromonas caviae TaxID=648 RepID=UPI001CC63D90